MKIFVVDKFNNDNNEGAQLIKTQGDIENKTGLKSTVVTT